MRGERRSVAIKRAAQAQEKGSKDASHPPQHVHPQEFVLEGCVERADDTAPQPTMRLVIPPPLAPSLSLSLSLSLPFSPLKRHEYSSSLLQ